jgi:hypothetical protein
MLPQLGFKFPFSIETTSNTVVIGLGNEFGSPVLGDLTEEL